MRWIVMLTLVPMLSWAQSQTETFIIQIQDRSVNVEAPVSRRPVYTVMVENRSLSDQVARFSVQGKILKYVSVKSGQSEPVEIENKTPANVVFIPVSPAFQEVELIFGKKAYEIPPKE